MMRDQFGDSTFLGAETIAKAEKSHRYVQYLMVES